MTDDFLVTTARLYGAVTGGKLEVLKRANFYGLTWNEEDVFWSWNPPHKHVSIVESRLRGRLSVLCRDTHQILWAQGKLWVTDTARDRVAWWNGEREGSIKVVDFGETDTHHFNSLWEWNGRVRVLASGRFGVGGFLMSLTHDEERIKIGPHFYHNFCAEGVWLYGCYKKDDLESGLYRKPLAGGETEYLPFEPGSFARGLARGDGYFLVGCSESLPRDQRFEGGSRVLAVSDDFEVVDEVVLEDTGQIRDVRLLRGDRAHNGLLFPGTAR